MDQIVHICSLEDWQSAQTAGVYRSDSLESEGFIHCSRPEQVVEVANRYYNGRTDLLLLWVDPSNLAGELRWEASDESIYPHVYGPINLADITQVSEFPPDKDGIFRSIPVI
jgi:uncharacterized protein (DUF952 family)